MTANCVLFNWTLWRYILFCWWSVFCTGCKRRLQRLVWALPWHEAGETSDGNRSKLHGTRGLRTSTETVREWAGEMAPHTHDANQSKPPKTQVLLFHLVIVIVIRTRLLPLGEQAQRCTNTSFDQWHLQSVNIAVVNRWVDMVGATEDR